MFISELSDGNVTEIKSRDEDFLELDFLSRGEVHGKDTFYEMKDPNTSTQLIKRQETSPNFPKVSQRNLPSNNIVSQEPQ